MTNGSYSISPLRKTSTKNSPWEGNCQKKPWDYVVTAVIPLIDTYDTVSVGIELLRLQSTRPFIILIDTGSCEEELAKVQSLAAPDVEVHILRLNGVLHPSDYPAMAMDMAFALCRTKYLFATHADVFLRNRFFLEQLIERCKKDAPVVGYEMSPRAHSDWKGMVSHTATMFHIPTMDRIGFGWSQRRLCNIYGIECAKPDPMRPNWPDTEILGNYILRKNKIAPCLIGKEENFSRQVDDNIDHCRSITAGRLYSPAYMKKAEGWVASAIQEANERIELWTKEIEEANARESKKNGKPEKKARKILMT